MHPCLNVIVVLDLMASWLFPVNMQFRSLDPVPFNLLYSEYRLWLMDL